MHQAVTHVFLHMHRYVAASTELFHCQQFSHILNECRTEYLFKSIWNMHLGHIRQHLSLLLRVKLLHDHLPTCSNLLLGGEQTPSTEDEMFIKQWPTAMVRPTQQKISGSAASVPAFPVWKWHQLDEAGA